MEKTHGRQGIRTPVMRPGRGRVQPFARPGYPDPGLTSHSSPDSERGEGLGHRRMIRPAPSEVREPYAPARVPRKAAPAEQTNAENFYYLKQMNARTPMVVVLQDGEQLRGVIEWYDRGALKVNREGAPNLLILKHAIKYLYKAEEEGNGGVPPGASVGPRE